MRKNVFDVIPRRLAAGRVIAAAVLFAALSLSAVSDGTWSSREVQTVCTELISACLESPAVTRSIETKKRGGQAPTVIVGHFANDSSEYIDTSIVSSKMETAIINDGRLRFIAGGDVRDTIRSERQDQQTNASEDTAKQLANETAADYMLTGTVKSIVKTVGRRTTRTYYVYAQLTNIETSEILWKGDSEVSVDSKNGSVRR
ncbi:MAG: penicillin-binding protein activator LpoB [Treponema sp.]|nr:penicillin-binding protein activator LpoB [Treponema sp.]